VGGGHAELCAHRCVTCEAVTLVAGVGRRPRRCGSCDSTTFDYVGTVELTTVTQARALPDEQP
jgi:hypothetical protein